MDGSEWKTLLKWMIWGYHHFWNHPYDHIIFDFLPWGVFCLHTIVVEPVQLSASFGDDDHGGVVAAPAMARNNAAPIFHRFCMKQPQQTRWYVQLELHQSCVTCDVFLAQQNAIDWATVDAPLLHSQNHLLYKFGAFGREALKRSQQALLTMCKAA